MRELERWIGPERRGVIAVLITAGNHQRPEPDQISQAVHNLVLSAPVADTGRQPRGNTEALLDLPQHQHARIR